MAMDKPSPTHMVTPMTDVLPESEALYVLSVWFSPSYPVGAFSYSHGLEMAVEDSLITDQRSAENFVRDILVLGAGNLDARLLAASYAAAQNKDDQALVKIAELAATFSATKELALESHAQGEAFLKVTRDCWPSDNLERLVKLWPGPYAYNMAVGVAASGANLPLQTTLTAYLHGFAANLISALVRLVPLGQTDGQKTTMALMNDITKLAQSVSSENLETLQTLENLASSTIMLDWCSMQHETQYTRLFRS
jgi:urease accessory protein